MLAREFFPTSAQPVRRTETIQLGTTTLHCTCKRCQMIVEPRDYRCSHCHDIGLASEAHGEPGELTCWRCAGCEVCALPADEQPDVCPFVVSQ